MWVLIFMFCQLLVFIIKFCAAQNHIHALCHRKSYFNNIEDSLPTDVPYPSDHVVLFKHLLSSYLCFV